MINPKFRLVVSSDQDHENLVGEIYYDDMIVVLLTHENSNEGIQLELFPPKIGSKWIFPISDFEEALAEVKQRLLGLQRNK